MGRLESKVRSLSFELQDPRFVNPQLQYLIRIQTDSNDAKAKNKARHQSSGYLYKNRSFAGTARAVIVQQINKQIVNTPFLIACLFPSRFQRRSTSLFTIGWDTRSILSSLMITSRGCLAFNPCRISSDDGTT